MTGVQTCALPIFLEEGMTFAVDGAVSLDNGTAGRVGDSVVVTKDGYEYLTPMDKSILVL